MKILLFLLIGVLFGCGSSEGSSPIKIEKTVNSENPMTEDSILVENEKKFIPRGISVDSLYQMARDILNADLASHEYDEGIIYLNQAVKMNHTEAKAFLGYCYYNGWRYPIDMKKGLSLLDEAAKSGSTNAMLQLSVHNFKVNNSKKGETYLKKAAESGIVIAEYELGVLYFTGKYEALGRPDLIFQELINHEEGLIHLTKAAHLGCIWAQNDLGHIYLNGTNVKKSESSAKHFFRLAIENPEFLENESAEIIASNLEEMKGANWKEWLYE